MLLTPTRKHDANTIKVSSRSKRTSENYLQPSRHERYLQPSWQVLGVVLLGADLVKVFLSNALAFVACIVPEAVLALRAGAEEGRSAENSHDC